MADSVPVRLLTSIQRLCKDLAMSPSDAGSEQFITREIVKRYPNVVVEFLLGTFCGHKTLRGDPGVFRILLQTYEVEPTSPFWAGYMESAGTFGFFKQGEYVYPRLVVRGHSAVLTLLRVELNKALVPKFGEVTEREAARGQIQLTGERVVAVCRWLMCGAPFVSPALLGYWEQIKVWHGEK